MADEALGLLLAYTEHGLLQSAIVTRGDVILGVIYNHARCCDDLGLALGQVCVEGERRCLLHAPQCRKTQVAKSPA